MSSSSCSTLTGRHWLNLHSVVNSNWRLGPANRDGTKVVSSILELTLSGFDPRTARALGLHSALQAFCGKRGAWERQSRKLVDE